MADDLQQLADWAEPLLQQLEPKARRALARKVAIDLRRSQRERIADQKNPDGSAFAPRKNQRWKQGFIRNRPMFMEIRKAKYLKASGGRDKATVGYGSHSGQALVRIARIHQYGLRANVDKNGPQYQYPARRLLGFSDDDIARIRDRIIDHIDAPNV